MKKIFLGALFVLSLGLAACGGNEEAVKEEMETAPPTESVEPSTEIELEEEPKESETVDFSTMDEEELKRSQEVIAEMFAQKKAEIDALPPVERTVYVSTIQTLVPYQVEEAIKEQAAETYPNDFAVQEHVINKQMASYNELLALTIENEAQYGIIEKSFETYGYDFELVLYVYNKELDAYKSIN